MNVPRNIGVWSIKILVEMKTKTLTHIAKVRLESLTQSEQVMELLGWNWDQYTEHQFEQYCLFVDKVCQGWPRVREEILYSPVFRGFWINQWIIRNEWDWLPMAIDCRDNHALFLMSTCISTTICG